MDTNQAYQAVFEVSPNAIIIANQARIIILANMQAEKLFDYTKEELIGRALEPLVPDLYHKDHAAYQTPYISDPSGRQMESSLVIFAKKKDGSEFPVEINLNPIVLPDQTLLAVAIRDVSQRKKMEEEEALLIESEKKYRYLFDYNPLPMWIYDVDTLEFLNVNKAAIQHYGYSQKEFLTMTLKDIRPVETWDAFLKDVADTTSDFNDAGVWQHKKKNGELILVKISSHLIDYDHRKARLTLAIDVTAQKKVEKEIVEQKKFTEEILNNIPADIAVLDTEQCYLFLNPLAISDLEIRKWMIGKKDVDYCKLKGVDDSIANRRKVFFERAVQSQADTEWIDEHKTRQGAVKYVLRKFHPFFENGQLKYVIGYGLDITERKKAEIKLNQLYADLQRANKELEQFAYMVSHDLQEPLRMVSGFLNLLKLETEGQLSESAQEYIHFAVDGAERMKDLIQDLLQYSRVGTNVEDFAAIDLHEILQYVTHVLQEKIKEVNARVTIKQLPVVTANKTLMNQLLMNLVSNALKYHSDEQPQVEIGSTEEADKWVIYVKDNGIGIDQKFFEKIFVIFQRLHSKAQYSGTGIGLAICKKIVEKHGGTIWVESQVGKGSTFYFTLLKHRI